MDYSYVVALVLLIALCQRGEPVARASALRSAEITTRLAVGAGRWSGATTAD